MYGLSGEFLAAARFSNTRPRYYSTGTSIITAMDFWFENNGPRISDQELRLFRAASNGAVEIVRSLLSEKTGIAMINGFNALHTASKKNHTSVIRALLAELPAYAESRTEDGRTALMIAASEGHIESCRELRYIAHLVDKQQNTALHYSVWGGHESCSRVLVEECGVDSNAANNEGLLPVQLASANNNLPLFLFLSGADSLSSSGLNSFHRACMYGSLEIVKFLVAQSTVDVSLSTHSGSFPMHLACKGGHLAVAQFLLDATHANVNARDAYALTPLHLACIG